MPKTLTVQQWMVDLAEKHHISVETVQEFYLNLVYDRSRGPLKERTKDFFDLYYEEARKEYSYGRRQQY